MHDARDAEDKRLLTAGEHKLLRFTVMAPNIGRSRDKAPPISPAQMRAALVELRRQVETNCDYVGERFAEEARRIHYGEADPHAIYGEASTEESRALADEGIEFGRIPWIQTDA